MTERMITDAELAEREKARFEWMAAHSREFQIKGYSETCGEEERDHLFTIWMTGELSLLDRLRNAERLLREARDSMLVLPECSKDIDEIDAHFVEVEND